MNPARWCVSALLAAAVLLVAGVALNWGIDPYHAFRRQSLYIIGTGPQRAMYAGLIRNRPETEAVVIGSSLGANFDPALVERLFGYNTQIVSLWGGSPRELHEIVKYSLGHKPKLRAIFVEFFPNSVCNAAWSTSARFPIEMYDNRPLARLAHLLSATTLTTSVKVVLYRLFGLHAELFATSYEGMHRTYEGMKIRFGDVAALRRLASQMPDQSANYPDSAVRVNGDAMAECFRSQYQSLIEQHPAVNFYFFTNPVFQWATAKLELRSSYKMYDNLAASLERWPNVQIHDFIPAEEIATDCGRWVDLWHFDQIASNRIFEEMKSGTYRRTAASNTRLNEATRQLKQMPADCGG